MCVPLGTTNSVGGGGKPLDAPISQHTACDPNTDTICYSLEHGLCIPILGCSGPVENEFDAMGIGFGSSGGIPGLQAASGGAEMLTFFDTGENAEYYYAGPAFTTATVGVSTGPYGIIAFNVHNASEYEGPFNVVNLTVVGALGYSVSYFWNGSSSPFAKGEPQGFAIGYSYGSELSATSSQLYYNLLGMMP
jgi:hypothetical protein